MPIMWFLMTVMIFATPSGPVSETILSGPFRSEEACNDAKSMFSDMATPAFNKLVEGKEAVVYCIRAVPPGTDA